MRCNVGLRGGSVPTWAERRTVSRRSSQSASSRSVVSVSPNVPLGSRGSGWRKAVETCGTEIFRRPRPSIGQRTSLGGGRSWADTIPQGDPWLARESRSPMKS